MESKVLFNHRLKGNGHNLVTNVGYIHVQQSSKLKEFDWWLMEFSRLHKDKTGSTYKYMYMSSEV